MRELKFRAWDGEKFHALIPTEGGTLGMLSDLYEEENWKVMQYTGLKDSEGEEIYEGDIVTGTLTGKPEEVFWSKQGAKFACRHYREYCGKMRPKLGSIIGTTVIGNIHQNPELIE